MKITYEQAYQENLDITFIMKYTDTKNKQITEISGFYYGKPNEENFNTFKESGVISVIDNE